MCEAIIEQLYRIRKTKVLKYHEKLHNAFQNYSPLCLGVDPSKELMESWELPFNQEGLRVFCDNVLEASADSVGILKPQSAFFEQFGPDGAYELQRFIVKAKKLDKVVILDCKRGDIGSTMNAYINSYIAVDSPFPADAITVHPYLGFEAIASAMEYANTNNVGIFIVLRSSNLESGLMQKARLGDGRTITDYLVDQIVQFNQKTGHSIGPVGAVVGATLGEEASQLSERLFNAPILAPGLGAQGATFGDIKRIFDNAKSRVIPSSSRGILRFGPSIEDMKKELLRHKDEFLKYPHTFLGVDP